MMADSCRRAARTMLVTRPRWRRIGLPGRKMHVAHTAWRARGSCRPDMACAAVSCSCTNPVPVYVPVQFAPSARSSERVPVHPEAGDDHAGPGAGGCQHGGGVRRRADSPRMVERFQPGYEVFVPVQIAACFLIAVGNLFTLQCSIECGITPETVIYPTCISVSLAGAGARVVSLHSALLNPYFRDRLGEP